MLQDRVQSQNGARLCVRNTMSVLLKDVIFYCYAGELSRTRKLLEKQKAGKKRMKTVGNVEIPQKAFLAVLKSDQ